MIVIFISEKVRIFYSDGTILKTSFVTKHDSLLHKMELEDGISKMLDSLIRGEHLK